ncbi:hypothetical protein ASE61_06980 [Bosea sp. Root670]|uniref:hypothetical protein n=1 Tax=Bosea sp. Root670 TaxID=1736583 RepID=UPI00071612ED|nr:hypothetical protein [Bosea sp. Root670]KRE04663.1 hypothetical protein ASE61_06980 [Bosea sp. Root670]
MTTLRTGFLSLPLIGSAHAARWGHSHGFRLSLDRATGEATAWLGRWEINASGMSRVGIVAALPLLTMGAMLAALAGVLKVSRA